MTRPVDRDHPAARVRESRYGRNVSGPADNERAPRASDPRARTRNNNTRVRHGALRWLTTVLLAELALCFGAVAIYFVFGPDPMRSLAPFAVAVFFVWASYIFTTDS